MRIVKFFRIKDSVKRPVRAHSTDAGVDVFAAEDVTLLPFTPYPVSTGLKLKIAEGYEVQVRPRSGLALRGVFVFNTPGTIDSGYEGEIKVILMFIPPNGNTSLEYEIKQGDKIAQLVVAKIDLSEWEELDEYISESDRGTGGFGSTGF